MLLELIIDTTVSIVATLGAIHWMVNVKKKEISDGTIPWAWTYSSESKYRGLKCKKCDGISTHFPGKKLVPQLCTCDEYYKDHFTCQLCGFKVIMRTADDE